MSALASAGKVTKVFLQGDCKDMLFTPRDNTVSERAHCCREEKTAIARYAAALLMREHRSVSSLILLPRGKRFLLKLLCARGATCIIWLSYVHCGRQNQIRDGCRYRRRGSSRLKNIILRKAFGAHATSAAATVLRCQSQAIRC